MSDDTESRCGVPSLAVTEALMNMLAAATEEGVCQDCIARYIGFALASLARGGADPAACTNDALEMMGGFASGVAAGYGISDQPVHVVKVDRASEEGGIEPGCTHAGGSA